MNVHKLSNSRDDNHLHNLHNPRTSYTCRRGIICLESDVNELTVGVAVGVVVRQLSAVHHHQLAAQVDGVNAGVLPKAVVRSDVREGRREDGGAPTGGRPRAGGNVHGLVDPQSARQQERETRRDLPPP